MTTTPPPDSFRAAFYAGARWSSATTDRPDAETALQGAWEAFGATQPGPMRLDVEPPRLVECSCGADDCTGTVEVRTHADS